jgi:uncharacterized membrane protein
VRTWLSWGLGCLAAGVIIHVLVVFDIAGSKPELALAEVSTFGPPNSFLVLRPAQNKDSVLRWRDPHFAVAMCHFSTDTGAVEVLVRLPAHYWSVELIDAAGQSHFSMNDRTGGSRDIKLLIGSRLQLARAGLTGSAIRDRRIRLETDFTQAIVRIYAFVPDKSQRALVEAALIGGQCRQLSLAG